MRAIRAIPTLGLIAALAALTGCSGSNAPDAANFKAAIQRYYAAHPACMLRSNYPGHDHESYIGVWA